MDSVLEFFGFDDDSEDESIWSDVHAYKQERMPLRLPKRPQSEPKDPLRPRRPKSLWATMFGKRKRLAARSPL